MARTIERIVWHTAAHGRDGQAFDTTAAQIDQWHRERGWSEIGYNVVIRFNGAIEQGRDPRKIPAGVAGLNQTTYHICFSGHGDIAPLTPQQLESGVQHTIEMLRKYGLVERFLSEPDGLIVMGHREVNELVRRGLAPTPTTKTCPGRLVDMDAVRLLIRQRLTQPPAPAYTYDAQAAGELYARAAAGLRRRCQTEPARRGDALPEPVPQAARSRQSHPTLEGRAPLSPALGSQIACPASARTILASRVAAPSAAAPKTQGRPLRSWAESDQAAAGTRTALCRAVRR
jgi:N-acetylmuramoyl-L-alanine amidase